MFESIVRRKLGCIYGKSENTQPVLSEMIKTGSKEICIVTGELNPGFYDRTIGKAVYNQLHSKSLLKVSVVFSKMVANETKARFKLREENEGFIDELRCLTDGELKRLHFYFATKRPVNHFAVVDDDVFIESYHKENAPRRVYAKKKTVFLAEKYKKLFGKIIEVTDIVHAMDTREVLGYGHRKRIKATGVVHALNTRRFPRYNHRKKIKTTDAVML